jgi:hypothetical protein
VIEHGAADDTPADNNYTGCRLHGLVLGTRFERPAAIASLTMKLEHDSFMLNHSLSF